MFLIFNKLIFIALGMKGKEPLENFAGYFKADTRGYHLYKEDGELAAYLVANPQQGYFAVSAFIFNGRIRYMHSTTWFEEKWLKLDELTYSESGEAVRQARVYHDLPSAEAALKAVNQAEQPEAAAEAA